MGAIKRMEASIEELVDEIESLKNRLEAAEDMISLLNDNLFEVILKMRDKFQ